MTTKTDSVTCCDALDLLNSLDAQCADAILTDLPYGTTACSWDTIIPFDALWKAVKRVLKPRGVFITTASQPFTSALVMSNPKWFKYSWVWVKSKASNHTNAKVRPMTRHEDVVVFCNGGAIYYPQGLTKVDRPVYRPSTKFGGVHAAFAKEQNSYTQEYENYPDTVLEFPNPNNDSLHPVQKPQDLYEYLIRTYTQPNDLIIDPCCGSGTTAAACIATGRHYIVGDSDPHYCEVTRQRLQHTSRDELNAALAGKPTTQRLWED